VLCKVGDFKERVFPPGSPNHTTMAVTGGNWVDSSIIEAAEGGVAIHGLGEEAAGQKVAGRVRVGASFYRHAWTTECDAVGHLAQIQAVYAPRPGYIARKEAVENAKGMLGTPYELVVGDGTAYSYAAPIRACSQFSRNDRWGHFGIYCSELIWLAYQGEQSSDACDHAGDACSTTDCARLEPGVGAPGLMERNIAGVRVRSYSTDQIPKDFDLKCLPKGQMIDPLTRAPNPHYLKQVAD
jgi:hypothetical protein